MLRNNDRFVGCVVPDELRGQWTLLRWSDRVGVPKAIPSAHSMSSSCAAWIGLFAAGAIPFNGCFSDSALPTASTPDPTRDYIPVVTNPDGSVAVVRNPNPLTVFLTNSVRF